MTLDPHFKVALRRDLYTFAMKAFRSVTGHSLEGSSYLEYVASQLTLFIGGVYKRCTLSMPPRTLKSTLGSIILPAYILGSFPQTRIMILAHDEALASRFSRAVRDLLKQRWFKEVFPSCELVRSAEMDFETSVGGGLFASSIDGNITGQGADVIILDDPVDIRDAADVEQLQYVNDLFDTLIRSRLNNKSEGRILIIAHRLNENDLVGHVARHGEWNQIALPLVARRDVNYVFPNGVWHRPKGDVLRPNSYTKKEIKHLRKTAHNPDFETLYQQNTKRAKAARIKKSHIPSVRQEDLPAAPVVFSVDTAGAPGLVNSFTVIQVWITDGERHFLIDQWREQANYRTVEKALRLLANKYNPAAILIERTAFGSSLCESRRYRHVIHPIIPDGRGKLERLAVHRKLIRREKIALLVTASFREVFLDELINFEVAQFTDQVDALTQYLDFMSAHPTLASPLRLAPGVISADSSPRLATASTPVDSVTGNACLASARQSRSIDAEMERIAWKYRFGRYLR